MLLSHAILVIFATEISTNKYGKKRNKIPYNKDNYAVVMKIFNPRKRGMFQFRALSNNSDEIPISTYLGTWNIDVR